MKRLIGVLLILFTISSFAQQRGNGMKQRNMDRTPDEIAEIQTKRLELRMTLTQEQREAIYQLHKENAIERQKYREERKLAKQDGQRLTKEERLKAENRRLDNQLRMQEQMKKVLGDEQFAEWKNTVKKQNMRMNKRTPRNDMKRNNVPKKMKRKF